MSLIKLSKRQASRVMGVDASTNSMAFGIIENDTPVKWGEINFEGKDVFKRTNDARRKIDALIDEFDCDFIAIEAAVNVRSIAVAIKMAYVFGSITGSLLANGAEIVQKQPLEWQKYCKNPPLTKVEKDRIKRENPGKSVSWYQNANREFRKQRTMDFVKNEFGILVDSDNVSDAIGIAAYAYSVLTRRS